MPDRNLTWSTLDSLAPVEYQRFVEWFRAYYQKDPPPNGKDLVNSETYRYWKNFVRPAVWSPEEETAATEQQFKMSPEEKTAFSKWYKGVYGVTPPPEALKEGSVWHTAFRGYMNVPSTPPSLEGEDTLPSELESLARLEQDKFELENRQFEFEQQKWRDQQAQRSWEQLNEQDRARWGMQEATANLNAQKLMSRFGQQESDWNARLAEAKRMQDETAWEGVRRGLIESASGSPRNWIQTSNWSSMPNPFAQQRQNMDFQTQLESAREDYKNLSASAREIQNRAKDGDDTAITHQILDPNYKGSRNMEQQMAFITVEAAKRARDQLNMLNVAKGVAEGKSWATGILQDTGMEIPRETMQEATANLRFQEEMQSGASANAPAPTNPYLTGEATRPEIPAWLQKASGINMGRVPTERQNIMTPSGQSWTNMSNTQQQMFAGFTDVAGRQTFEDVMGQMQKQLPQAPSLGRRWQPARQRI